jgi:hypothetical protein
MRMNAKISESINGTAQRRAIRVRPRFCFSKKRLVLRVTPKEAKIEMVIMRSAFIRLRRLQVNLIHFIINSRMKATDNRAQMKIVRSRSLLSVGCLRKTIRENLRKKATTITRNDAMMSERKSAQIDKSWGF